MDQPSAASRDSRDLEPLDALRLALERHAPAIALACTFSASDVVVLDMLKALDPAARVFAIDTGRFHNETYELAEKIRKRYGDTIEWVFPRRDAVEEMVRTKGPYSFRQSVANRKECCQIRKSEPLARALAGQTAWISGLRRGISAPAETRQFEVDEEHGGIERVNPIIHWSTRQVWDYIRERRLPYNPLYERGYAVIGCQPCSSPIMPGEHPRDTLWRWEPKGETGDGLLSAGAGI